MSKKYEPSGYQIIKLDLSAKTSGTAFSVATDDEKLLCSIINDGIKKPILLSVIDTAGDEWMGIPSYYDGVLTLTSGAVGSSIQIEISAPSTSTLLCVLSAE